MPYFWFMAIEHARNDKGLTREDLAERIRKSERYDYLEKAYRDISVRWCTEEGLAYSE